MAQPAVLIVGAGALGITTGYHLALGGAAITFFVRPPRVAELGDQQRLYCLDDGELKRFAGFASIDSAADAGGQNYDFVLVTMDGATCRGEEATALLRALGDVLRPTEAVVLVCGIGVREYCRDTMGLPDQRVAEGTMAILSYQVERAAIPVRPPGDPDKLAQADLAYRHVGGERGFMVSNRTPRAAKAFVALYNQCGVSRCATVNGRAYTMFTRAAFPTFAVFDLAGWPDAATMAENRELMELCAEAIREILRLPEHGWMGRVASLLVSRRSLARQNLKTERACLPLDYSAFNRFHHGGKVLQQDIGVMQLALESGRKQGRSMPALEELLERYQAHCTIQPGERSR